MDKLLKLDRMQRKHAKPPPAKANSMMLIKESRNHLSRLLLNRAYSNRVYLKDLSATRQLIYTGPFNPFIQRLKMATVGSAAAAIVGSPILLHYLAAPTTSWTMSLLYFLSVSGASVAQAALAHGLLKRYVLHAYRLVPGEPSPADEVSEDDHLELVTLDVLGRPRRLIYSASQLEPSADAVGAIAPLGGANQKSFVMLLKQPPTEGYFDQLMSRFRSSSK
jgi:hypothetical protein